MYDSATENISHSFENLHAQGIDEVIGNELAIEENVIDNVEGNGSDQESDTDSENKSDDEHENTSDGEHENANDDELFENSIIGRSWSLAKLFIMQNYTENANGDVPLTAENVWFFWFLLVECAHMFKDIFVLWR